MRIKIVIVALCALFGFGLAVEKADAQIVVSVGFEPPPLPVYDQPPIPEPGYIWTPGYWAWDEVISDYYWVPGAWVLPPEAGVLWTPGYWGWGGGSYVWNAGYWGPAVGFYGGICYGFGYTGVGFAGGYWSGGSFYYNRAVTNISNTTVINTVYNHQVVNINTTNVSYNGGDGGVRAQPTSQELLAAREHHIGPTPDQMHHLKLASANHDLHASVNNGRPGIAAVSKAGDFSPHHIVAAHAAGVVKPASLAAGNALQAGHPGRQNGVHPLGGNPMATGKPAGAKIHHGDPALASKGHGGPGMNQPDAIHGANKNGVANLTAGPTGKSKNPGSGAAHTSADPIHPKGAPFAANGAPFSPTGAPMPRNGAPFHANAAPFRANGAPFNANGAPNGMPPRGAAMTRMGGGPVPHGQPHPAMPKPPAHAQPHPAGQPKKDQPHG